MTIKCNRCKVNLPSDKFKKKRCGNYQKNCNECLEKIVKWRYEKEVKCSKCEKKFSSNGHLKQHIKQVHDKIKDFECQFVSDKNERCDAKFSTNGDLKQHIKAVHDKIKDVECDKCDYKCSTKGHLNQHIKRIHDKIKDFECFQCDYKFSTKGHLQRHIKQVHDKIKDVECQFVSDKNERCDAKFSTNGDLQKHIKMVHDKIKDFECDKCNYKCSDNNSLKKHIKQVHDKIKDFECDKCDYKCSTNSLLKQHIKTCTGNEIGSSGEVAIKRVLDDMKIEYEYDSTHSELTDYAGKRLRFDFRIPSHNLYLEYDGRQHFKAVGCWGGEEGFKKTQENDKIKNEFCEKNNYKLLRIPYTEYENINSLVVKFIRDNTDWGDE